MAKKQKYKGIKSSIRNIKSKAKKMHEEGLKKLKSLSARNIKAKPLANSVKEKAKSKSKASPHVVQVLPMKPIGTLVQQLPATALTIKGMSIKGLIRKTPKLFKFNAEHVVIKKLKKSKTKTGLPAIIGKAFSEDFDGSKPTLYDLYIIGIDSKTMPVSKQKRVLVSCNCANYVYTWEYANAFHGASKIIYGNGEAPGYTNPGYLPGMCKHLIAFSEEVLEKGM